MHPETHYPYRHFCIKWLLHYGNRVARTHPVTCAHTQSIRMQTDYLLEMKLFASHFCFIHAPVRRVPLSYIGCVCVCVCGCMCQCVFVCVQRFPKVHCSVWDLLIKGEVSLSAPLVNAWLVSTHIHTLTHTHAHTESLKEHC